MLLGTADFKVNVEHGGRGYGQGAYLRGAFFIVHLAFFNFLKIHY